MAPFQLLGARTNIHIKAFRGTLIGLTEMIPKKRFRGFHGCSVSYSTNLLASSYRHCPGGVYVNGSASVYTRDVIPASIAGVTLNA
jgi:hypothetical protein